VSESERERERERVRNAQCVATSYSDIISREICQSRRESTAPTVNNSSNSTILSIPRYSIRYSIHRDADDARETQV